MYPGDASWLDTSGRLLLIAFFLSVGIRNLQAHHVEDHVKRLTNFKAPLPRVTFWVGQSIEFIGCALVLFNWYPAVGVLLLLFFTIVASSLLLRFWEVEDCRTACWPISVLSAVCCCYCSGFSLRNPHVTATS